VSEVLSPEWCQAVTTALADLPPGPGGSGVAAVVATGGEFGRVTTNWLVEDGRLIAICVDDGSTEAEVSIPQVRGDLEAVIAGERDAAVAFMRGDLKPEGSSRALFALLSALARGDVAAALRSA
jgi:hypothetical protein